MPDSGAASVALVGAASLLGGEIKQQLSASGFPSEAVALLDAEELAGMLTEYGDEVRGMTETSFSEMLKHDLVCFCGQADFAAAQLEPLLDAERIALDCTGAWARAAGTYLWLPGVSTEPTLAENSAIALPSGATQLIAVAVAALGDLAHGAVATILAPASERGERGLKELSQQSVAVLNLEELEDDVFGRQLAFDLWPPPGRDTGAAAELAAELQRLDVLLPAVSVLAAPVFHGIAANFYLPAAAPDAVTGALADEAFSFDTTAADDLDIDSPVRAAGHPGIHVGAVLPDEAGGTWVWLVMDNLNARAAAAVAAIHTLLGRGIGAASPSVPRV